MNTGRNTNGSKGKNRRKWLPVLVAVMLLFIMAGAATGSYWYFTSDGYQYRKNKKMAEAALADGAYGEALGRWLHSHLMEHTR